MFSAESRAEPNIDDSPWLLETTAPETAEAERPARTRRVRSARPGKSFGTDIDDLFAAAIGAVKEQGTDLSTLGEVAVITELQTGETEADPILERSVPARLGGIDGIIRDTTDGKANEQFERKQAKNTVKSKRVTFTYDRGNFAKLKAIARDEGSYLKDIMSHLLNDYINARLEAEREPSLS